MGRGNSAIKAKRRQDESVQAKACRGGNRRRKDSRGSPLGLIEAESAEGGVRIRGQGKKVAAVLPDQSPRCACGFQLPQNLPDGFVVGHDDSGRDNPLRLSQTSVVRWLMLRNVRLRN